MASITTNPRPTSAPLVRPPIDEQEVSNEFKALCTQLNSHFTDLYPNIQNVPGAKALQILLLMLEEKVITDNLQELLSDNYDPAMPLSENLNEFKALCAQIHSTFTGMYPNIQNAPGVATFRLLLELLKTECQALFNVTWQAPLSDEEISQATRLLEEMRMYEEAQRHRMGVLHTPD